MNQNDNHRGDVDQRRDLNARDAELAQRIAKTLDDSTDTFDSEAREQLAMLRHRVLSQHSELSRTRRQRFVGAVALAASILALIATPWMLRHQAQEKSAEDMAYLSVEPEMLEDMDMLLAIGEPQ